MGGGERVLWCAVNEVLVHSDVAIYTTTTNAARRDEILTRVQKGSGISVSQDRHTTLQFVPVRLFALTDNPRLFPVFTLLLQKTSVPSSSLPKHVCAEFAAMELATHLDQVALGFITPQEEAQLLVDGRGFICGVSNGFRALFGGGSSASRERNLDLTGWNFRDVFRDPVSEQLEWAPWVQDVAQREEKLVATISDARGCKKWVSCMRILGTRKFEKQEENAPAGSRKEIWCIVRARSVWMGGVRFAILSLHHVPETRLALAEVLCDCEALTKGVITGADLNNWLDEMETSIAGSDQESCEFELSGVPWAKKSRDESSAMVDDAHPQPRTKVVDDATPAGVKEEEKSQSLPVECPQNPAPLGCFLQGGSSEDEPPLNMNGIPPESASSTLGEAEQVALQRLLTLTQAEGADASQSSPVEIARLAFLHGLRAAMKEQAKNSVGTKVGARTNKARKVSVVLLPEHISPQHDVQNSIVVLIQHVVVSAAVTALGCGASAVQLCGSVYSLQQVAACLDAAKVVKCGVTPEGQTLAGFDKGVDAKSFAEDLGVGVRKNNIAEKSVLLYTTNGTRAIPWVQDARRVVLGSLLNASAVVSSLLECPDTINGGSSTSASATAAGTGVEDEGARLPIVFVCCGYNRGQHRSVEDELIAAYLLFLLMQSCSNPSELLLDDAARLVLQEVDTRTEQSLVTDLKRRFGKGPTTVAHGRERLTNVDFLLQLDLYANTLPVYCPLLGAFLRQHQCVFIERAGEETASDKLEPGVARKMNETSIAGGDQGFFNARKQISSNIAKSRAIGAWPKQRAGSPKQLASTDVGEADGGADAAGRAVVEKAEAPTLKVEVLNERGMQSDQHTPVTARTSSRELDHAVRADLTNANPGVLVTGAAAFLQCSAAFPMLLGGEGEGDGDATAPSGQHATDADDNPTCDHPHSQRTRLLPSRYSSCLRQRHGSFGSIFPQSGQQHKIADQFGSLDQSTNLKKVRLFAVRHGDYEKSVAKSMVGHLNPTLSDAGRDEAAALASWLADQEKFALVICSPLLRAAIDSDLTAIDRGDWSGLPLSEIHRYFPGEWATWCEDPYWDAHGGEAYVDIMLRVRQSLLKILRRCLLYANEFADRESGTANVCVVTHCSIVCSLIGLVAGLSQKETVPLAERLKPSSVTLVEVDVLPSRKNVDAESSESREPAFVGDVKYVGKTVADFNDGAVRALVEEEMSTLGLGTTLGSGAGSTSDPHQSPTSRKADLLLSAEVLLTPLDVMAARTVSHDQENQATSAGRLLTVFGPAPPTEEESQNTGDRGTETSRRASRKDTTTSYLSPSAGSLVLANSWVSIVRLPRNVSPKHYLSESLVVLIDVLRMSSTIVTAMGEGLNSCRLFSSVAAIKHASKQYLPGDCLLGGELKRALMPGFDRDNSPLSYLDSSNDGDLPGGQRSGRARAQRGADRIGLFLTTNGTRALPWVKRAKFLVLGSFLNLSAVVRFIMQHAGRVRSILFVCSGQDRGLKESVDDEMCAAYLLKTFLAEMPKSTTKFMLDGESTSLLRKTGAVHPPTSVSGKANLAADAGEVRGTSNWRRFSSNFAETHAAIELKKLGLGSDVSFCLQRDRYADVLPLVKIYVVALKAKQIIGSLDPAPSVDVLQTSTELAEQFSQLSRQELEGVPKPPRSLVASMKPSSKPRSLVASSPLRRARVVAERIAAELNVLPIVCNELTARDAGDWTGLTEAENLLDAIVLVTHDTFANALLAGCGGTVGEKAADQSDPAGVSVSIFNYDPGPQLCARRGRAADNSWNSFAKNLELEARKLKPGGGPVDLGGWEGPTPPGQPVDHGRHL
eukprot:g15288.t1